ncbi:MAG: SseB family protein [Dermatophilaceae bacterium]
MTGDTDPSGRPRRTRHAPSGASDHGRPPPADRTVGATDSAEVPWAGRELTGGGFEGDTGAPDRALLAALAADPVDDVALARAVENARLLVPVVAIPVDDELDGDPATRVSADMAAVTLVAPDGRRALPAFSGTDSLAAWDATARPVPVTPARAAQAAVAEGCEVMVLDVAGPSTRVLRASMVWALAQQRPWLPAHEDPIVLRAVTVAAGREPHIAAFAVEDGSPPGEGVLGIVLTVRPNLTPDDVRALATRVGERLATDGDLRARVDGLAFRIV